jgi:hypothetical protein
MNHLIKTTFLISLCACSISDPMPAGPGVAGDTDLPAGPDTESLPSSARLVPEPVDSVEDVPGRYAQPFALPGQVNLITLEQPSFNMGSYELYRSCGVTPCAAESGQYNIVPTNPAIGFAALSLVDQTGLVRTTYILDLLWRDADGQLVALQLRPLLGNATGPTQVWWRLPEAGPEPTPMLASAPASDAPAVDGVFVRALPIYGDIGAITLDDATWSASSATGTYTASYPYCLPWCLPETGTYELDLENVTTGTGHLDVVPAANPTQAHHYAVYAIWRGVDGTPAAIQLQRVDGVTPSGPPFTVYRQWWTGASAAPAPADTNLCTTWLALAGYYRIRALQCGMSACWTLAPWYSAWANYYQGLADAAQCSSGVQP